MDYKKSAEEVFVNMIRLSKHMTIKNMSDISKGEMAILGYLYFVHNGATAGELSEASGVVSSRIAAVLNALEKKKYAIRKPDPSDKRRVLVYTTAEGEEAAKKKYTEVVSAIEQSLSMLGEEDATALMRILKKLAENEEYMAMYHFLHTV